VIGLVSARRDGARWEVGMPVPCWSPKTTVSAREQWLLKRLTRTKKLFAFLRMQRHELFDEAFQRELSQMYRESDEGKEPIAPALLAMVVLLQAYTKASDAEAVELSVVDARWQMVLDVMGNDEPAFCNRCTNPISYNADAARKLLTCSRVPRQCAAREVYCSAGFVAFCVTGDASILCSGTSMTPTSLAS
jgi:hypothetical protein